jgi:hypothetical protein
VRFFVLRQRNEGRLMPRHTVAVRDAVHGELSVHDQRDGVLHRQCRVARLVKVDEPHVDILPPLKDATLLYVDRERWVLTGFEHILDRDYAQTWMLATDVSSMHALAPVGACRD